MTQAGGRGRLAPKLRLGLGLAGEFRAKDLERDRNLQVAIDGLVDPRERAATQKSDDPVFSDLTAEVAVWQVTVLYRLIEVE
jgi:hypothetical protein